MYRGTANEIIGDTDHYVIRNSEIPIMNSTAKINIRSSSVIILKLLEIGLRQAFTR